MEKLVLRDSLVSGITKSCGLGPCKQRKRVKRERGYTPTAPRSLSVHKLGLAWARYHHPDLRKREGVTELAERYGVKKNTLLSMFQSIRRAGGWDKYKAAVHAVSPS